MLSGAAVGGAAAAWWNSESIDNVLNNLPNDMIEKLYTGVKALLQGWEWSNVKALLEKVLECASLMDQIVDRITMILEKRYIVFRP